MIGTDCVYRCQFNKGAWRYSSINCVPQLMKGAEARGGDDGVWACLNSWMPSLVLPPTLSLKRIISPATAV